MLSALGRQRACCGRKCRDLVAGRKCNLSVHRPARSPLTAKASGEAPGRCARPGPDFIPGRRARAAARAQARTGPPRWGFPRTCCRLSCTAARSPPQLGRPLGWSGRTVHKRLAVRRGAVGRCSRHRHGAGLPAALGAYYGIVPDGLDDLVTDLDWAGDSAVLLEYIKGRTRRESLT